MQRGAAIGTLLLIALAFAPITLLIYDGPWILNRLGLRSSGSPYLAFRSDLGSADADYVYGRSPPPGFDDWHRFAREKHCELRRYDAIERDLAPFRRLAAEQGAGALLANQEKAKELEHVAVYTVRRGRVSVHARASKAGLAAEEYKGMLDTIAGHLPDMQFVINLLDEPRVLVGPGSIEDRYAGATCANASADFRDFRHLHGYIISPATMATDANELLPIFSQTKIPGCHSDIIFPSHYNYKMDRVKWMDVRAWRRRKDTLFFRGSSTGGFCHSLDTPYWNFHRQRLAEVSNNDTAGGIDMGIVAYIQCTTACCEAMKARYGIAPRTGHKDGWQYKFMMILDGNSFSSRLPKFLSSGSLLFRAGLFCEWFDDRFQPWRHYLPVRLDFSNLRSRLDWALAHDVEAKRMAVAARRLTLKRLRHQDMQCYILRLLLEYNALFGDVDSFGDRRTLQAAAAADEDQAPVGADAVEPVAVAAGAEEP